QTLRSPQGTALATTPRTMAAQRALRPFLLSTSSPRRPLLLRLATKAPAARCPDEPGHRACYVPPRPRPARRHCFTAARRTRPGQRTLPPHPSRLRRGPLARSPPRPGGLPMLSLSPTIRIFLCAEPADLRKSFDGL